MRSAKTHRGKQMARYSIIIDIISKNGSHFTIPLRTLSKYFFFCEEFLFTSRMKEIFILRPFDGLSSIDQHNLSNEMQTKNICNASYCGDSHSFLSHTATIRFTSVWAVNPTNQFFFCWFLSIFQPNAHYPFSVLFSVDERCYFGFMFICFLSIVEMIQLVAEKKREKNLSSCHYIVKRSKSQSSYQIHVCTHGYQISYLSILDHTH